MNCKCNGHAASNKWHQRNKQVNAQNNHMSGEHSTRQHRKIYIVFLCFTGLHHAVRKNIWLRTDFFWNLNTKRCHDPQDKAL